MAQRFVNSRAQLSSYGVASKMNVRKYTELMKVKLKTKMCRLLKWPFCFGPEMSWELSWMVAGIYTLANKECYAPEFPYLFYIIHTVSALQDITLTLFPNIYD